MYKISDEFHRFLCRSSRNDAQNTSFYPLFSNDEGNVVFFAGFSNVPVSSRKKDRNRFCDRSDLFVRQGEGNDNTKIKRSSLEKCRSNSKFSGGMETQNGRGPGRVDKQNVLVSVCPCQHQARLIDGFRSIKIDIHFRCCSGRN